jgi:ligand-binding sensor protein
MSKIFRLTDLVPLDILENIMGSFSDSTKVSSLITDYLGHPITTTDSFCPLCKALRATPAFEKFCLRSDASACIEAAGSKKTLIYKCYGGLVEVILPLVIDENYLGSIFIGQVMLPKEEMDKLQKLPIYFDVDFSKYPEIQEIKEKNLKKCLNITYSQLQSNITLIQTIADYIINIAFSNLTQDDSYDYPHGAMKTRKNEMPMKETFDQSQLIALQHQIDSFFLFSVFNSIYRQSILENAEKTSVLLESLISILRRNLSKGKSPSKLGEEIDHLNDFINLKNALSQRNIRTHTRVDPLSLDCYLPFFAMQPLVENLFLNGGDDIDCKLEITAECNDDTVTVKIAREDLILEDQFLEKILDFKTNKKTPQEKATMIVQNVIQAFQYYYGDKFVWKLEPVKKGKGAVLEFSIPAQYGNPRNLRAKTI